MTDNLRAMAVRQAGPVALRSDNMDTLTVARMLAESGFFGEVRDAGKALAKILAGQELGMGPIASLMGVYYQQGKVTYSANIMAAAVKKTGLYTYRVKKIGTVECSIEFFEKRGAAWDSIGVSDFSIQDATDAGLTTGPNKHNWKNYPRNMLFARAMSNGVKWFTPDVFGGITPYTPDELGGEVTVTDNGDMHPTIVDVPSTPVAPEPEPAAWPEPHESRWNAGVKVALEIGATVPDKPSSGPERVTALNTLGANVKARQAMLDQLTEVVGTVNAAAGEDFFEVPDDVFQLADDDIREMIAQAQTSMAQEAVPA